MPDLAFAVTDGAAKPTPEQVILQVDISNRVLHETIESVTLRCQVQIECARRRYSPEERSRLVDLFGEPERWRQTLRPMLWANVSIEVPAFIDETSIGIAVPCTSDQRDGPTKYFQSLDGGTVPITLLFSGMAFYRTGEGRLQVSPIAWDREARFAFPVDVWNRRAAPGAGSERMEVSA